MIRNFLKCNWATKIVVCLMVFVTMPSSLFGQKSPKVKQFDDIIHFKLNPEERRIFDTVQYKTFQYFWNGAEPNSGMACERVHMDNDYPEHDQHIVTTGGSGFGVMAIMVGIYRGWITETEGADRLIKILDFLEKADRFHGAWPHWIDGETGKVKPFGQKDNGGDLVESSFLMQGLLCVKEFIDQKTKPEKLKLIPNGQAFQLRQKQKYISDKIDQFWREMEFDWYTRGEDVLYWHWSPSYGWQMNFKVRGYNECLIMYVLAASSPTHPISAKVYHNGWAESGKIKAKKPINYNKIQLDLRYQGNPPNGGPLFWSHYSYLGLNPMGLADKYCSNYGRENMGLSMINYLWCINNPMKYKGYGDSSWGLTASYSVKFYAAHAPDSVNDVGVISPTAAMSSYPYTPIPSTKAMVNWVKNKPELLGQYGFYDAFSEQDNWMKPHYLAIDQGPAVVMMENYRSGLFWALFMSNNDIQNGLLKLGFKSPSISVAKIKAYKKSPKK